MKSALPWILVVVLLGGSYFLYSANKEKEIELGQSHQDLEALRAENADLKKPPVQQDEVSRLRKDNEDLIRLRAEVQRLTGESKKMSGQLATAQMVAAQAKAAQQQVSAENLALRDQREKLTGIPTNVASSLPADLVNTCIQNLRLIDHAKQQWALANNKGADDVPTLADITPYLPPRTQLFCPGGGAYTINAVNVAPTCNIPGHVIR